MPTKEAHNCLLVSAMQTLLERSKGHLNGQFPSYGGCILRQGVQKLLYHALDSLMINLDT